VEQTRQVAGNANMLLTIGHVPTAEFQIFPKIAPLLRRKLPQVRPSFRIMRTAQLADAVRSGEVDVSFLRLPADLRGLKYTTVSDEGYAHMLPHKHRLARKKNVKIKSLSGEPHIFSIARFSHSFTTRLPTSFLVTGRI
jgi:LysR family hca operon transcriptional activator